MRSLDGAQTDAIISDQKRRSFCQRVVSSLRRRNQPALGHPDLVRIKRPKISLDSEEESEQIHHFSGVERRGATSASAGCNGRILASRGLGTLGRFFRGMAQK